MPTPNEDSGTQYIEISDFSPGIFADRHDSDPPRFTASDTHASVQLVNGAARVAFTEGCRADKHGALIPLPKAQPTGMRDAIRPGLELQATRPYRYVLDAQLGNTLVDGTEVAAAPYTEESRQLLHIMWGMYVTPES